MPADLLSPWEIPTTRWQKISYRLEKLFAFLGRTGMKTANFLWYVRTGKWHGYPTCCVLHFAWDVCNHKKVGPAEARGVIFGGTEKTYVPCGFHKGRHPEWTPYNSKGRRQLRLFDEAPPQRKRRRQRRYSHPRS